MKHTLKKLEKSQLEIVATIEPGEYETYLKPAAQRISQKTNIKGFRKGKAPYERVKQEVGDMNILQEALETIVQKTLLKIIKQEKLETVGPPQINIEKIAPDNELVFKAILNLLPEIELPDLNSLNAKKKVKKITDEQVDETINTIRKMQAAEIIKPTAADKKDKLVIDMEMLLDKVPIEGGASKDYQVYLSEEHYVPGFGDQLVGLKKGDKKEFSLTFPKEHYQKNLAGKQVDFKITVKDVYSVVLPKADDELAKKVGQKTLSDLKNMIKSNLEKEADHKANQAYEIELLENLIEKSKSTEIPQIIIDAEKQKMFYELKRDLDRNGISIEKYLSDIKKTEKELFTDFAKQAEKRAKAALISRQIALKNNLKVIDEEIDEEIKKISDAYKHNQQAQDNLKKPEVRDSIAATLQNKKVMEFIKKQAENKTNKNNETKNPNN